MMYHNKFAVAIRVNGKILRENGNSVALPFGSEYQIRLKNINSVRAQVKVSIDGTEVSDGWLVIQPNSHLDLERSIINGNLSKGNRFKFIERTDAIEQNRGIKVEDGLVRVEYKFEKPFNYTHGGYQFPYVVCNPTPVINLPSVTWTTSTTSMQGGLTKEVMGGNHCGGLLRSATDPTIHAMNCSTITDAPGITVPGSISDQQFVTTSDFACEASEVIVLKLTGKLGKTEVVQPVTVDAKPKCVTCGRLNKTSHKFCSQCGTSLEIV